MTKQEFINLAIRSNNNGGNMNNYLYDLIESFYMSDNEYHKANGGIYETKQEFVKRVFGGKVNTTKTIIEKTITEAIKENTYALQYNKNVDKKEFDRMNLLIREHTLGLSKLKEAF